MSIFYEDGKIIKKFRKRRNFGSCVKKVGMTQANAVKEYYNMGKSIDEMAELLKCPTTSIRGRLSELRRKGYI